MLAKFATSLAAIIALTQPFNAHAESWFEVEVFIFERQSNSLEQWPDLSAPNKNKQLIDILTPEISTDITGVAIGLSGCDSSDWAVDTSSCNDPKVSNSTKSYPSLLPFTIAPKTPKKAYIGESAVLLAEHQGQFKQLIKTLTREGNIQGIVHLTWQQNMQSRRQAKAIRVIGGRDFSKQFSYHGQQVNQSQSSATADMLSDYSALGSFSAPAPVMPVWELDGSINIYLSHYLYIETDVFLRKVSQKLMDPSHGEVVGFNSQGPAQKVMTPFLQSIPLQQNRRVRSGEIHYFDHPQMGIVMQIRKMTQPTQVKPIVISAPVPQAVEQPSIDPYQQLEQEMQQDAQQKLTPQIKPYEG
ncbi:peptidoglycan binding protein CsiV [Shewanella sp.]|uniref:peptidoglycan binding protein CsiV n=1 Tax=Shewanella sp. TaxID=50422 RepID=UPI0040549906